MVFWVLAQSKLVPLLNPQILHQKPPRGGNSTQQKGLHGSILQSKLSLPLKLQILHKLRVSQNRVMSRIIGTKREEVSGGLRKLHNEELHNLYSLPNIRMNKSVKVRCVVWDRWAMP
jgi:hypothetical protein